MSWMNLAGARGRLVLGLAWLALGASTVSADEPASGSRLGRLFRLGGSPSESKVSTTPASSPRPRSGSVANTPPSGNHDHDNAPQASARPLAQPPMPAVNLGPVTTPNAPVQGAAPRIAPQPRNAKAPTDADPIVTRIAIGRSDNGSQFGMFMHVYADGTIVDSEGVHRVSPDALKPVFDALRQGEIYRQKGYCGAPATDFVEQVHMVVYDRSYGRLRATSFIYSGNTHGCDPSIKLVHTALDNLQARMAGQPVVNSAAAPTPAPAAAAAPVPLQASPIGTTARSGASIGLSNR